MFKAESSFDKNSATGRTVKAVRLDGVTLYLDGQVAVIHDIGLPDLRPIDTGDELDVRIGRKSKGLLDDLRIYSRILCESFAEPFLPLRRKASTGGHLRGQKETIHRMRKMLAHSVLLLYSS